MRQFLANIGWWLVDKFDPLPTQNVIEAWAKDECRPGVSPGAAARQLCRSLGAAGCAPTLKSMLEEMLADANRASFDRYLILEDFAKVDPQASHDAKMASFRRQNGIEEPLAVH